MPKSGKTSHLEIKIEEQKIAKKKIINRKRKNSQLDFSNHKEDLNSLLKQASFLLHNGRWFDAKRVCDLAVAVQPDCFLAYHYRGVALGNFSLPDNAMSDISKSIKLKNDVRDKYNFALSCLPYNGEREPVERAVSYINDFIEAGVSPEALWIRGFLYSKLKDFGAAVTSVKEAIKSNPFEVKYWLSAGIYSLYAKELKQSLFYFEYSLFLFEAELKLNNLWDPVYDLIGVLQNLNETDEGSHRGKRALGRADFLEYTLAANYKAPGDGFIIIDDYNFDSHHTNRYKLVDGNKNESPYHMESDNHTSFGVEIAKGLLQDALTAVAAVPQPKRKDLIEEFQSQIDILKKIVPDLPEPDNTGGNYSLYERRTDPIVHLEKIWGTWLKKFNPLIDKDFLTQKQLRERDPTLFNSLKNYLRYHNQETVSQYITPEK